MHYRKTIWKDRDVERHFGRRIAEEEEGTSIYYDLGEVVELGTSVNAENLNNIEEGISNLYKGIVLYDEEENYNENSVVGSVDGNGNVALYKSLTENNKGKALSNTSYWQEVQLGGSTRNLGEIVPSTIPLVDSGLHLLDGALLDGSGVYGEFVSYMAELYGDGSNIPSYFTTETDWQSEIALNGVCGKFVYDSENNTLRLPKYGNQIYTTDFESFDIPVLGNGYALGLTEGTHTGYLNSATNGIAQISSRNQATPRTTGSAVINAGGAFDFLNAGVIEDAEWSGLKGVVDLSQTVNQNVYYYIVVSNKSSKSAVQIDIDEIATDLNGKADRDGSNMVSSVKNFDGGFIKSYAQIADHVSMPTSSSENITLDLSSYLPDDNYNYEVLFTGFISTLGTATKQYCALCLTTQFVQKAFICSCESSASSISAKGSGTALIPVGADREVTIVSDSYSGYTSGGTITLRALAYRRIGTNS